jgi:hypothetical protein
MRKLIAILLATALAVPAVALADADPASDVLLGTSVFYPYSPAVPAALQKRLNAAAAAAARAHFPLKIALISQPIDLGAIPDLFGKPQQYANFLDQEISYQAKQPLLVVMPAGYGSAGLPAAATAAVATLPKPAGASGTTLAQTALAALPKLSASAGHPIGSLPGGTGQPSSGGGSSAVLVVILAAVAIAAAVAVIVLRRRAARR